jgi:hypothetical protein
MIGKCWIYAILIPFVVVPRLARGDDAAAAKIQSPQQKEAENGAAKKDAASEDFESHVYPWAGPELPAVTPSAAVRFGWWGVHQQGAKTKVGEWQGLSPSPFWDVDAVFSDRQRTLDLIASGLDNDANSARVNAYGPNVTAKVQYDRFLHRLDHVPLQGTPVGGPIGSGDNVVTEDLNVGQDYAIRVQQLKTSIQGQLGKNFRWRVNMWGMRKSGERQANAVGHCFDLNPAPGNQQNKCHILSQRQQIDWLTMEIEPVLEAQFGDFNVTYSRTMRAFETNDQDVTRTYTRFGFSPASGTGGPPFEYAVVPENFTQIDRLQISGKLWEDNQFYGYLYNGDTKNEDRQTHRWFNGYDVRLTNHSIAPVTFTVYSKMANQRNQTPPTLLPEETLAPDEVERPINYSEFRNGFKAQWRPFYDLFSGNPYFERWNGFFVFGGYEYYLLSRDTLEFDLGNLGTFTQPNTQRHEVYLGMRERWSRELDSYMRYRGRFYEDPLIGFTESSSLYNTKQPEQEHGVDLRTTWTPAQNFMASAQVSIVNSFNHTFYSPNVGDNKINFTENSYPFVCTIWYAPTDRLSLTGGYANFTSWIDQDVAIGFRQNPLDMLQSNYRGKSELVTLQATYAWSPCLKFIGGFEWNRGRNVFSLSQSMTGADFSQLPSFSDVIVETTRFIAGVDYQFRPKVSCYFRYNYFDFADKTQDFNSGTAHFFLGGIAATY